MIVRPYETPDIKDGLVKVEDLFEILAFLKQITGLPTLADGQHILELGCGPGAWTIDVAQTYYHQHLHVTGIDMNQQMVDLANAEVHEQQLDDVCRHIQVPHLAGPHPQFADHSFDVISAQFLSRVLTRDDWLPLLEECRRLLRPGGQIFLTDFGSSISNSPAHEEFWSRLIQWLRQSGRSFAPGNRHTGILCELEPLLSTVGFGKTRISCDIVNCSYGADYHEEWKRNFLVFSKRIMSFLLSQGLSTSEQIDRLLQRLQIEMNLPSFHALLPVLTVCGQK